MNYLWILLVISASLAAYYWGKHKGLLEEDTAHWLEIDSYQKRVLQLKQQIAQNNLTAGISLLKSENVPSDQVKVVSAKPMKIRLRTKKVAPVKTME